MMVDSSSSSSEDEARNARLKEALDPTYCNESLFFKDDGKSKKKEEKLKKKSQRRDKKLEESEENQISGLGLAITPEFKKFVGNKLASHFDKSIEEVAIKAAPKLPKKSKDGGIRLFAGSTEFLTLESSQSKDDLKPRKRPKILPNKKKKIQIENGPMLDNSSEDEEEKIREAALSPSFILMKRGVFQDLPSEPDEIVKMTPDKNQVPQQKEETKKLESDPSILNPTPKIKKKNKSKQIS